MHTHPHHHHVATPHGTVALTALVPAVVNAILAGAVIPYGDYGGDVVYYFTPSTNGLGSLIYTAFDRHTHVGLASHQVRWGAATTVHQLIFGQWPRNLVDLRYVILPQLPVWECDHTRFIPPQHLGDGRDRLLRNTTIPQ